MSETIDVIEALGAEIEAIIADINELRNENTLLKARVRELERKIYNLPEDIAVYRND